MKDLAQNLDLQGNPIKNLAQGKMVNNNHLAQDSEVSFADKLQELKNKQNPEALDEKLVSDKKPAAQQTEELVSEKKTGKQLKNFEAKQEEIIKHQELQKQQAKTARMTDEAKDSLQKEASHKLKSSETEIASAAQANKKQLEDQAGQAHNAAGKAQEEQQQHQQSQERKHQLANWGLLQPRIAEDAKNMAVKLEIPGLNNFHTVIVKKIPQKGLVIQTVGDKGTMELFKRSSGLLKSNLSKKHKIRVANIDSFYQNNAGKLEKVS